MITSVVLPIVVIVVLVLVNGVFVAAEFALVGARRSRLQTLADGGSRSAGWLLGAWVSNGDIRGGSWEMSA